MQAVSRLAAGRAEIVGNALSVWGGVYSPAAEGEITGALSDTLPKGFTATAAIEARQPGQPVSPERCRDLLGAELRAGRIDFDNDKSEISDRSFGMLDRVGAVLQRCPDANVEIAAHTDSDGSTARNRELSEARAQAIVDYLADAGVKRERLKGIGYGESKPIADNATDAGKAQNRRIEFTMTVPGEPVTEPAADTPTLEEPAAAPGQEP
jgi:OOP family OmpA-OmpF porin